METHPEDLRPSKHHHIVLIRRRALPFAGNRCCEIVQLHIVRELFASDCSAVHVFILVAFRHVC